MTPITAIIPCHNAGKYIAGAIESILRQSRPVAEIVVVDDGSTDNSVEIASAYNVRLLKTNVNSGHAAARNLGISAASGEYIAWLDADDYWEPEHLDKVCGLLDQHAEAAVAYSSVRCFGARDNVWPARHCLHRPANVLLDCLATTIVPAMSAVTRTSAIKSVGGFDDSIRTAPDFDLWNRMALRFLFVCTDNITANYRWHPSQISANPFKQELSMHRSRAKFLRFEEVRSNTDLLRKATELTLRKWDLAMWVAWARSEMKELRTLLDLDCEMPNVTNVYRRLQRRRWMPPWLTRSVQLPRAILAPTYNPKM